ncbi:MAG: hypothetical protein VX642_12955 [Bdellovibrionota bacterium]|nr:hypothetical protein [Bdellovibrionota bacterium]
MKLSFRPIFILSLMSSILFGVACSNKVSTGEWSFNDGSWVSMDWFSEKLVVERTKKIESKMNMQSAPLLKSVSAAIDEDFAELSGQDIERVKGTTVCVFRVGKMEFAEDERAIEQIKEEMKLKETAIVKLEQELDRMGDEKNRPVIKVSPEILTVVGYVFDVKMECSIANDSHEIVLKSKPVSSSAQVRFYQTYNLGSYDFTKWRSIEERDLNLKEMRHNANLEKAAKSSITLLDISYEGLDYLDINGLFTTKDEFTALRHKELCEMDGWEPSEASLCESTNQRMKLANATNAESFFNEDHMEIMSDKNGEATHKLEQFFGEDVKVDEAQFQSHLRLDSYLMEINLKDINRKQKNSRVLK